MSFFTSKLPASFSAARKSMSKKDDKKKTVPVAGIDTGLFPSSTSGQDVFTPTVASAGGNKDKEGSKEGGRSGGSKGSKASVSGKSLTTLLFVEDVGGICGGEISTSRGERWCTKEDCSWGNHQEIKAEITSNTWYIKVPGNKQCFLAPSLPEDMVPADSEDLSFSDQFMSIEAWRSYIGECVHNAGGRLTMDGHVEAPDVPGMLAGERAGTPDSGLTNWESLPISYPQDHEKFVSNMMSPPPKLKLAGIGPMVVPELQKKLSGDSHGFEPVEGLDDGLDQQSVEEQVTVLRREVVKMGENVEMLARIVLDQGAKITVANGEVVRGLEEIDSKARDAMRATQVILSKVGSLRVADPSIPVGATVWEAVGRLREEVSLLLSNGGDQYDLNVEFSSLKQRISNSSTDAQDRMTSLETMHKNLFREHRGLAKSTQESFAEASALVNSVMDRVQDHGQVLEQCGGVVASGVQNSVSLDERIQRLESAIQDVAEGLQDLRDSCGNFPVESGPLMQEVQEELNQMEKRLSRSRAFEFDGSFITCKEDVEAIFNQEGADNPGVFVDMHTLWVIMKSKALSGKELADRQHSANRVDGIRSVLDCEAIAALTHPAPRCLFSTKPGSTELLLPDEGFGADLSTYKKFRQGTHCAKNRLTKEINRMTNAIKRSLSSGSRGDRLALALVETAKSQAIAFLEFFCQFEDDLVENSNFDEASAWGLVGRCIRAIFELTFNMRSELTAIDTFSTIEEKAEFAFTMLQTTQALEDIIEKGFRSHPAIIREVQLFLLEKRVDKSQLIKVDKTATEAKDTGKKVEGMLEKVKQELGSLKATIAKLPKKA